MQKHVSQKLSSDETEMIGQFVLDRGHGTIREGWTAERLGPWRLSHHVRLPVIPIRNSNGAQAGWLLGMAIEREGRLLTQEWVVPAARAGFDGFSEFEAELLSLAGRFVAIYLNDGGRVYLDAFGSMSVVFCPEQEMAASSPGLIPRVEGCGDNEPLVKAFGLPEADAWYPLGLTPRWGVDRILPNHYLDLTQWSVHRHWPTQDLSIGSGEPAECVEKIGALIERTINAVTREFPVQMALTAGRDSRVLLACSKSCLDRIHCYTTELPDTKGRKDSRVASALARKEGFVHKVLPWIDASAAELQTWLDRTGPCSAGRIWKGVATENQLDPDRVTLLGIAGEVGRKTKYWRIEDTENTSLSPSLILERLEMPRLEVVVARAQRWLDEFPLQHAPTVLDFLYIEQRVGCWAGPSLYGSVRSRFNLIPYCSAEIFRHTLALPITYRWERRFPEDLIRSRWPELLQFPFNELFGWRASVSKLQQMAKNVCPPALWNFMRSWAR